MALRSKNSTPSTSGVRSGAIKGVGPAVILATQDIFAAAAESDGPSAMTANVAEGAQCTFLIANDDDWFTSNMAVKKLSVSAIVRFARLLRRRTG